MDSGYHMPRALHKADSANSSDSELSQSRNENRDYNNRRLTQAINYMAAVGGVDPPATFINRVNRIDEVLVRRLPQISSHFDQKLYRRVRAMVRATQREYEDAMGHSSLLANEAHVPELLTRHSDQALHRSVSMVPTPRTRPLHPRRKAEIDNVPRQRAFKYGGPSNEVEIWMKDYPASLPFPETFQMSMWESLKIDFDLSEAGKKLKLDGKVVETNVSFNHPVLTRFKAVDQYESGSRFTLPKSSQTDIDYIEKLANQQKLAQIVLQFNDGDRATELKEEYVPRVALESFSIEHDSHPTAIRKSLNTTPSKVVKPSHTKHAQDRAQRASSKPRTPATAALRAIQHEIDAALQASPRRQSSLTTTQKPPTTRTATHVAIPAKHPRRGPCSAQSTDVAPSANALGKRKRLGESAARTPNSKRKKSVGEQAYTPSPTTPKQNTSSANKTVRFSNPMESAADEVPARMAAEVPVPATAVTEAVDTPAKSARKKRVRKVFEEKVSESEWERMMQEKMRKRKEGERIDRGRTRSGVKFK